MVNIILFLSGINLIIIQFIIMREFAIAIFCTEFSILLVSISYFLGYSVGYFISTKVTKRFIVVFSILTLITHLIICLLIKVIVGYLARRHVPGFGIPVLFFIGTFFISSFYTIFLPKFISESGKDTLSKYYAIEISGTIIGLLFILTVGKIHFSILFLYYLLILVVIIYFITERKMAFLFSVPIIIFIYFYYPNLDKKSAEYFYNNFYHWFKNCQIIYQKRSPYQNIQVIRNSNGFKSLYLNGLEYFNVNELESFNFYLSELPARLQKKCSSVLILGSGSMSSVYRVHPFANEIITVEIDKEVYKAGKEYFREYNHLNEISNWKLVIDDAKHYLRTTDKKFDLIIVDIPPPYCIQTALLFTKEFYSMIKSKLNNQGIVSVYLCGWFLSEERKPLAKMVNSIVLSVATVFNDFFIINSYSLAKNGFIIAGDNTKFTKLDIAEIITERHPSDKCLLIDKVSAIKEIKEFEPNSFSNLSVVLDLNLESLYYAFTSY